MHNFLGMLQDTVHPLPRPPAPLPLAMLTTDHHPKRPTREALRPGTPRRRKIIYVQQCDKVGQSELHESLNFK